MRLLVWLGLLCLTACSTMTGSERYEQTVASWRWSPIHDLLKVWGNPNHIVSLPNSNKVYIYSKSAYKNYPLSGPGSSVSTLDQTQSSVRAIYVPDPNEARDNFTMFFLVCKTFFEVDPQDIIVDVRTQGNDCTADAAFFFSNSNPESLNPDIPHRVSSP